MGPSTRRIGLAACALGWMVACGGDEFSGTAPGGSAGATTGGSGGSGGGGAMASGGEAGSVGGASSGGNASGGAPSGGAAGSGGASSGGTAGSGGTSSGGTAGTGGLSDAGSDASTSSCNSTPDCRLYSSYCENCECIPLKATDPDPVCAGKEVSCTIDPCVGKLPSCAQGECAVLSVGGSG